MTFRQAIAADLPQIALLYRSAIGTPGYAWNEAAIRTYQRLGFAFAAEAEIYDGRYYLREKKLI